MQTAAQTTARGLDMTCPACSRSSGRLQRVPGEKMMTHCLIGSRYNLTLLLYCTLKVRVITAVLVCGVFVLSDSAPRGAPGRHAGSLSVRAPSAWRWAERAVQHPSMGKGKRCLAGHCGLSQRPYQPDADTQRNTGIEITSKHSKNTSTNQSSTHQRGFRVEV